MAESRIDELRRRAGRDPGSRLFAQLAEETRKAGDLAEAIRIVRTGLGVHPTDPAALVTLGRALIESGDLPGGRSALEEAVRQAPENILAGRLLGEALEGLQERGEEAVPARPQGGAGEERGVPADPGPPLASPTLGELYVKQGLVERAVEVYRQVVAEHSGDERSRMRLAELVAGQRAEDAARHGEAAIKRRALERTIGVLEILLGAARRR